MRSSGTSSSSAAITVSAVDKSSGRLNRLVIRRSDAGAAAGRLASAFRPPHPLLEAPGDALGAVDLDAERGALTWTAEEAHPLEMIAADQKSFKGAVPLEMISAVTPSEAGVSVEIADRTFVLRPPKDAAPEARDAFVSALRKAVASHPSHGRVEEDTLPRSHWKDAERYRERQRMTRVIALAA